MMAETPVSPTAQEIAPLDRAAPVIARVKILSVVLAESQTMRTPDADLSLPGLNTGIQITKVEFGSNHERKQIFVVPSFALRVTRKGDEESEATPLVSVEAKFVVIYTIEGFDGLDDDSIAAFGVTNGVFNVWPYWREFAQNSLLRMGLPVITIPLFRVKESE